MNLLLRLSMLSNRRINPKPKPDWLETNPGNFEYLTGKFNMTKVDLLPA